MAKAVIAIAGSSGLIGSALAAQRAADHSVVRIVRRAPANSDELHWTPESGEFDSDALCGVEAVDCAASAGDERTDDEGWVIEFAGDRQGVPCLIDHPVVTAPENVEHGPIGQRPRTHSSWQFDVLPVAIGEDCVIERAEVEHSILLAGSSVRNLAGRMESSLLGRNVTIGRDQRQPRAYRFLVGDNSEVGIL